MAYLSAWANETKLSQPLEVVDLANASTRADQGKIDFRPVPVARATNQLDNQACIPCGFRDTWQRLAPLERQQHRKVGIRCSAGIFSRLGANQGPLRGLVGPDWQCRLQFGRDRRGAPPSGPGPIGPRGPGAAGVHEVGGGRLPCQGNRRQRQCPAALTQGDVLGPDLTDPDEGHQ